MGVRPSVCPSVRPYVRMSVTITEKPPKSAHNSLKTLRLYTEPLRTHLFARPGLLAGMLIGPVRIIRFKKNPCCKMYLKAFKSYRFFMFFLIIAIRRLFGCFFSERDKVKHQYSIKQ